MGLLFSDSCLWVVWRLGVSVGYVGALVVCGFGGVGCWLSVGGLC